MLLQVGPGRILGGFLLIAVLSTLLANTAAYFVTGDSQLRASVLPGVAVALVGLLQAVVPVFVVVLLAVVVDGLAVAVAYGLDRRSTAIVTAIHYALIVTVGFVVQSSLAIYQTAPG